MTPERWKQISQLFEAARAIPVSNRAAFLAEACGSDTALRDEVQSLLDQPTSAPWLDGLTKSVVAQAMGDVHSPVLTGRRFGDYLVGERIDSGGIGDVYRARDTRLGRDVAMKVLQPIFADDRERRARFEREARLLAALDHPHVGTIYGVEESDGTHALMLALVEGDTVAERLARGPIPVAEALEYARQIADGLQAAHEKGIIHRDLKPANIKITPSGLVKVLDFGLAKAVPTFGDPVAESSPTSTLGTGEGIVLGTAAYVSPEQAQGKSVDRRADIWAFGVVLFEMLSGRRGFRGDTTVEVLSNVLKGEPDWDALPPTTPATVRSLLRRSLQKDPSRRPPKIADARFQIEEALKALNDGGRVTTRRWWAAGLAAAVGLVAAGTLLGRNPARPTDAPSAVQPFDSIAVLPFRNATLDEAHDYIAATLGDQIGVDLGGVRSLQVISGASTRMYRGSTKALPQIATELKTAGLLQGSTRVNGNQVRVMVELTEASSQRRLWGATYEGDVADIFNLSKSITRAVVGQVNAPLTADERRRVDARAAQVNPAVMALLHGGAQFSLNSPDGFNQGRRNFERAIELDPSYAPAYIGLAGWYLRGLSRGVAGPPADLYAAARKAAAAAVRLDPESAAGYGITAQIVLVADWDWQTAASQHQRALDLNPSMSCHAYRHYLAVAGRYDEALVQLGRCPEINPLEPSYPALLAWHHLLLRQYDSVIAELDQEARLNGAITTSPGWLVWRPAAEALRGRTVQAADAAKALVSAVPGSPHGLSVAGFAFGRTGDTARVRGILQTLRRRRRQHEYIDPFLFATVEAGLGNRDQVFAHLGQAADEHSWQIINLMAEPWFDEFREDPRYQELVRRIGFPNQTHRAESGSQN
jgi:TolB-like protein